MRKGSFSIRGENKRNYRTQCSYVLNTRKENRESKRKNKFRSKENFGRPKIKKISSDDFLTDTKISVRHRHFQMNSSDYGTTVLAQTNWFCIEVKTGLVPVRKLVIADYVQNEQVKG